MSEPITCTELTMTCSACPSQWNGVLSDGRHLYCRYRWGGLSIGVGETHDDAVRDDSFYLDVGDGFDGTMSTDELMPHLTAFLGRLEELTYDDPED